MLLSPFEGRGKLSRISVYGRSGSPLSTGFPIANFMVLPRILKVGPYVCEGESATHPGPGCGILEGRCDPGPQQKKAASRDIWRSLEKLRNSQGALASKRR
jgi:hypothetical protein